jgi:peptidoglycan/LPS O-acetylase OafA/YrhL
MRIGVFDVLRAVLAWWVVAAHAVYFSNLNASPWHADLAVNGFVLMSGFVITLLLTEKGESYGLFICRRILRLAPGLFVCLSLAIALRPWTLGNWAGDAGREASETSFFWQHLVAHLSLLYGMIPDCILPHAEIAFLPPAWSVSLEMQLYLIAPLLIWGLKHYYGAVLRLWPLTLFALVPQLEWRGHYYFNVMGAFFPQKFYLFMAGALIYSLFPSLGNFNLPPWTGWLSRLGRISYSTYLVHCPLLAALSKCLAPVGNGPLRIMMLLALGIPIIVTFSALLYRYVEIPAIGFGKRLTWSAKPGALQS